MRYNSNNIFVKVVVVALLGLPVVSFAQSDGSAPPAEPQPGSSVPAADPTVAPEPAAAGSSSATDPAVGTQPGASAPASDPTPAPTPATAPATTPKPVTPVATPGAATPAPVSVTPSSTSLEQATTSATTSPESSEENGGVVLWIVLAVLSLIPFGYVLASFLKKKPSKKEESDKRCFDVKRLMEEKLKELTDVRAMVEKKVKSAAKESLQEIVEGTATGDMLVRLEKIESEYERFKKMYEECTVDVERYRYKGILVENSLMDKAILDNVKILGTSVEGEIVRHSIRLSKKQIEDIQRQMSPDPWYFHLWEPGQDTVIVVFKDALYTIRYSDKATWADALSHGAAMGIPGDRMRFEME